MKKFSKKNLKILILTLVAVGLVAVFASCGAVGGKISSFDKILNTSYTPKSNSYNGAMEIKDVKDAELSACNEEIAVFKSVKEDGAITYTVYSFRVQKVVSTFTSSQTVAHNIELFGDTPVFFVEEISKKVVSEGENTEGEATTEPIQTVYETSVTYTLYDHKGTTLQSKSKDIGRPVAFADMLIYGSTVYTVQADGALKTGDTA